MLIEVLKVSHDLFYKSDNLPPHSSEQFVHSDHSENWPSTGTTLENGFVEPAPHSYNNILIVIDIDQNTSKTVLRHTRVAHDNSRFHMSAVIVVFQ